MTRSSGASRHVASGSPPTVPQYLEAVMKMNRWSSGKKEGYGKRMKGAKKALTCSSLKSPTTVKVSTRPKVPPLKLNMDSPWNSVENPKWRRGRTEEKGPVVKGSGGTIEVTNTVRLFAPVGSSAYPLRVSNSNWSSLEEQKKRDLTQSLLVENTAPETWIDIKDRNRWGEITSTSPSIAKRSEMVSGDSILIPVAHRTGGQSPRESAISAPSDADMEDGNSIEDTTDCLTVLEASFLENNDSPKQAGNHSASKSRETPHRPQSAHTRGGNMSVVVKRRPKSAARARGIEFGPASKVTGARSPSARMNVPVKIQQPMLPASYAMDMRRIRDGKTLYGLSRENPGVVPEFIRKHAVDTLSAGRRIQHAVHDQGSMEQSRAAETRKSFTGNGIRNSAVAAFNRTTIVQVDAASASAQQPISVSVPLSSSEGGATDRTESTNAQKARATQTNSIHWNTSVSDLKISVNINVNKAPSTPTRQPKKTRDMSYYRSLTGSVRPATSNRRSTPSIDLGKSLTSVSLSSPIPTPEPVIPRRPPALRQLSLGKACAKPTSQNMLAQQRLKEKTTLNIILLSPRHAASECDDTPRSIASARSAGSGDKKILNSVVITQPCEVFDANAPL